MTKTATAAAEPNQPSVRDLIAQTISTGRAPAESELASVRLRLQVGQGDRHRAVGQLRSERRLLGRYLAALAGRIEEGAADHEVERYATQIRDRFSSAAGDAGNPAELARSIERAPKGSHTPLQPTNREALRTMRVALRDVAGGGELDTDHLAPHPALGDKEGKQWQARLQSAAQRITDRRSAGHLGEARALAEELAEDLAGDLWVAPKVDQSEMARMPDGSYDPAALASLIPRGA